jgi:hypothetical protein
LDIDVKKPFGWVGEDVYDVNFGWDVCMRFSKTPFNKGRVNNEWVVPGIWI